MIQLSSLSKSFGERVLLDAVTWQIDDRERVGLAGPNGAGKTTLLRALTGEASLQGGELAWEKGARVALHDQRPPASSDRPLREYVLAGTADPGSIIGLLIVLGLGAVAGLCLMVMLLMRLVTGGGHRQAPAPQPPRAIEAPRVSVGAALPTPPERQSGYSSVVEHTTAHLPDYAPPDKSSSRHTG